jgi:mannitol/fructose-specific phosphotransferase system IIA component (Ntr-type)
VKHLERTFSGNDTCLLDLTAKGIEDLIPQVIDRMIGSGLLPAEERDSVIEVFLERERIVSTAIGNAVAVPHCYLESLSEPQIVFVRLKHGINLGAPDGTPTQYFFFLLGPTGRAAEHLDTLSLIARLMSDSEFRYELGEARNPLALRDAFAHTIARTAKPVDDDVSHAAEMAPAAGLGDGVCQDIKRRLPHYKADFLEGLHPKSISSTLFLLFACLAPAITFGGIMAEQTGNHIGAVEMIAASAFCGVIYALFSGQPLIILGGTGPLLVFTVILYEICGDYDIPFLPTYAWVGVWTAVFLLILSLTNASNWMRYFTRFTDEIFAALISIIFIHSAVNALVAVVVSVYSEDSRDHDAALVPLLLAMGTFYLASNMTAFRRSRYLHPKIREFFADFGPSISMGMMLAVALFWFHDVDYETLPAPDSFRPTLEGRAWFVNLFDAPVAVWFGSIVPALLVTVLAYMDQNITARLVNSPDHKLTKGEAYHFDLGLLAFLIGACSLFGLPWLVAATVRSLNHVRSLATLEEVVSSGGETRERIIHVRENRLTGFAIHLLIGCSLLLLPYLNEVPMAILYGLFLFMGIVSMKGNQLFERLSLWIMDSSLYPRNHYTQRVPRWTMHLFTLIQLGCLTVLLVVKVSAVGILFPLFIALLVPVRLLLNRFFAEDHLKALDADEIPEEEETQWS